VTLRLRLTALTTVLLAIVLAVSGVVLERFMARDLERSLEKRARDRTRAPLPGPSSPGRANPEPRPPPDDGPNDPPEMFIVVGLRALEGDPRPAELWYTESDLTLAKVVTSPGTKELHRLHRNTKAFWCRPWPRTHTAPRWAA